MKKRITSMVLAVLMVLSVISADVAFATYEDEGIMPYTSVCGACRNGIVRPVILSRKNINPKRGLCPCWAKYPQDAKYNCIEYEVQTAYADRCESCGVTARTYTETRTGYWKHDACKGSGCGH